MSHTRNNLQEYILSALWRLLAFPGTVVSIGVALALISSLIAFLFLSLNSDQDKLVSPDVPFQKNYLQHLRNFGDQEYLYVVIKTGETEEGKLSARRFADSVAERLNEHPELIRKIHYRISADDLGDYALLFASTKEAQILSETLVSLAPSLGEWLEEGTLAGLFGSLAALMDSEGESRPNVSAGFFVQTLDGVEQLLDRMRGVLAGRASDDSLFDLGRMGMRYFFTSDGRLLVMRLLPDKDFSTMEVIGEPLNLVRRVLEAVRAEFPDVEAGLTGRPALQADEMQSTNDDMTRAAIIDSILVGLLFLFIFHSWLRPALIMAALGMAMAWTFGFATLAVGELNLLSVVFALVMVGIGVDYGVHMMMRFVEGERNGLETEDAVRTAVFHTGPGVILGVACAVCGFYAVLGSDFVGLAQLGLIGGTGILFCLVTMMVVLPAMLLIAGRKKALFRSQPRLIALPFLDRVCARPVWVLLIIVAISVAAIPGLFKIRFNYNLLDLQAKGLESVKYEKLLIEASDESTWYSIFTADSVEGIHEALGKLESLPTVGRVDSILDFIPEEQTEKSALYAKAARALDMLPKPVSEPALPDAGTLIASLERLSGALENVGEKLFAAGAGAELSSLARSLESIDSTVRLLREDPTRVERLAGFQAVVLRDVRSFVKRLKLWLSVDEVTPEDLPSAIRDMYVGKDGRFQIKVTPSGDVWDFDNLERFVSELRNVDPAVSGVPVVVFESARMMHRTFVTAAGLTVLLISIILWLYSRSVKYTLLTLLPLAAGMLWLLQIMGWLGVDFNLANFFAIPILIAIGVDGGVHLLDRWEELKGRGSLFDTSTPTAVSSSFITTTTGFGGLLFAHHQGLASLGAVMVLGSLTGLLACILLLPASLEIAGRSNRRRRQKTQT